MALKNVFFRKEAWFKQAILSFPCTVMPLLLAATEPKTNISHSGKMTLCVYMNSTIYTQLSHC